MSWPQEVTTNVSWHFPRLYQGALKGTDLRRQTEPNSQTFTKKNRRFSQIQEIQALEGAGNRRKPQVFAENRRKLRIGVRRLRSVTFISALL